MTLAATRRRRILPGTLTLGPNRHPKDQVRDAEAFCRHELDAIFRRVGMHLDDRPEDYEDSLSRLIAILWRLNELFDPERNDSFANYARPIIRRRAIDVGPRRLLGRSGHRKHDYLHAEYDESTRNDRHHEALPDLTSDEDPDRGTTPGRLQDQRNREIAWAASVLGVRAPRRAA